MLQPTGRAAAAAMAADPTQNRPAGPPTATDVADPVLCTHCGRTASNGISCQGICVADSGY